MMDDGYTSYNVSTMMDSSVGIDLFCVLSPKTLFNLPNVAAYSMTPRRRVILWLYCCPKNENDRARIQSLTRLLLAKLVIPGMAHRE